jgi:hypothetical protein
LFRKIEPRSIQDILADVERIFSSLERLRFDHWTNCELFRTLQERRELRRNAASPENGTDAVSIRDDKIQKTYEKEAFRIGRAWEKDRCEVLALIPHVGLSLDSHSFWHPKAKSSPDTFKKFMEEMFPQDPGERDWLVPFLGELRSILICALGASELHASGSAFPASTPDSTSQPNESEQLTAKERKLLDLVRDEFRSLSNPELWLRYKRRLKDRGLDFNDNSFRCCVNRIRQKMGFPGSAEVAKKNGQVSR